MNNYLLISDSDSDNDNDNEELEVYTPKKLNDLLLKKMNNFANDFENIIVVGDIIECRNYTNLTSFKLKNNKDSFNCIVKHWIINPEKIKENINCIVRGSIITNNFHGPRFQFDVSDIEFKTDDTKLKRLKEECQEKGYFFNKKKN